MLIERPDKPQGRHVSMLRTHLKITQTNLASLLGIHQPDVSSWEAPHNRDVFLPAGLARRFLEVWDCFPSRPAGGFDEMMALLAAFRKAPPLPAASAGRKAIRLVPSEPALDDEAPELYWVPRGPPSREKHELASAGPDPSAGTAGEGAGASGEARELPSVAEHGSIQQVVHLQLSFAAMSILIAVWRRARTATPSGARWRRWGMIASLAWLLIPTGCFQLHQEALRGQPGGVSVEREPSAVPGQVYAENAKANEQNGSSQRSIPLPKKPYSWQKPAPCDRGEAQKVGGCWGELNGIYPPCPDYAVESEGKCLMPIPAKPKEPSTVIP